MSDDNAQLRSHTNSEAAHADHFKNFLDKSGITNITPTGYDDPMHTTYVTGPNNTGVQIYYIGLNGKVVYHEGTANVLQRMAPTVECDNHLPMTAIVQFTPKATMATRTRRSHPFSRADIPANVEVLQQRLEAITLPTRDVEPSTHCHLVDMQVLDVLAEVCPPKAAKQWRKSYFSENTRVIIDLEAAAWKTYRHYGRLIRITTMRICFYAIQQASNADFNAGPADGTCPGGLCRHRAVRKWSRTTNP